MIPENENNNAISEYIHTLSQKMGMTKIQDELRNKSNEESKRQIEQELQKQRKIQTDRVMSELHDKLGVAKKKGKTSSNTASSSKDNKGSVETQNHYDPFHSILRFFNPNTSTNCFKGAILAPAIDFVGKVLNFANDKDCENVSDYFASKEGDRKSFPWASFTKVVFSSFGAFFRGLANLTDWATGLVFRPINSARNLVAALRDPKNAAANINRHYQILEHKPTIERNATDKAKTGATGSGKDSEEVSIKTLTLNTGLMRDVYWDASKGFLNNLRRPRERAAEIAEQIIKMDAENPQDVICLQEVFDNLRQMGLGKDSQSIIMDKLKERFPYIVYDVGQRSFPLTGSGLMMFSKYPIVDVEFHRYPDLLDLDTMSNKGFLAAKLQKGDRFFTVYNTHTQAGSSDSFKTEWMDKAAKKTREAVSTSMRRSNELAHIAKHMEVWQTKPPARNPSLKYLDTILMGDLNEGLSNANKIYGVSHGKKESRIAGRVKYPGKNLLFKNMSPRLPDNFVDVKIHEPIYIFKKDNKEWVLEFESNQVETQVKDDKTIKILKAGNKVCIDPGTGNQKIEPLSKSELDVINKEGLDAIKVKKGLHPLKLDFFHYTLSKLPKEAADKLKEEVFFGSSINKETLIRSLPNTKQAETPKQAESFENVSENKLLDINISRIAHKPNLQQESGVRSITHYQSSLKRFKNEKNQDITDHCGLQMTAKYSLK